METSAQKRTRRVPFCGSVALLWFCGVIWTVSAQAHPESTPPVALTLSECYQLALQRSETIAIQQERLKETEGRFLQALSGALPRASFVSSDKRQDGSGGSAFTLRDVPERRFTFSQPLFGGFKEFAAMAASRAEHRQRTHDRARAEQLLLLDVADAFYLLIQQREELGALEVTRSALLERIEALRAREQLGRSRSSEVASAEAQLRRVEAERERIASLEATARQLLEFLTGLDRLEAIAGAEEPIPPIEEESVSLAKAGARPDVQAAEEAWQVAKQQVLVTQGAIWPDVDLEGNYYTKRVGASQDVDWDVTLKVDVPLFQGGQAAGAVREAAARSRQAKLQREHARRQALLDIRDARARLAAAVNRRVALEQAVEATERNYRLHVEDYALNLVSNLDVLQTLQELQDVRRDLIGATADVQRLSWRLRVAVGEPL